jgi:hypothetical protein
LIVFIKLKTFALEKSFETFHVFVGHCGAAVKQENFDAGILAKAFGPDFEVAHRGGNGDHFYTCGFDGVAILEVIGNGGRCGGRRLFAGRK